MKVKVNINVLQLLLNGRDLYKLYYDEKLTDTERAAIHKRLDELDENLIYNFQEQIASLKACEKEWEYDFGKKLNPLDIEDLMEIKKGERLWLYYLESLIVKAIHSDAWSNTNSKVRDYPEFVPTEDTPTPLFELMDINRDIKRKIYEIENWLTEHGWVKRESIVIDNNVS